MTKRDLPVCPLTQSTDFAFGWVNEDVWWEETIRLKHLVPCGDLRLHQLDPSCWCKPVEAPDAPDYWIHNSADGREAHERGKAAN